MAGRVINLQNQATSCVHVEPSRCYGSMRAVTQGYIASNP